MMRPPLRAETHHLSPAHRLVRESGLHLGVSGHDEAVQAVGDDTQACGDQQRCSVGLGPKCFQGAVDSCRLVRLCTNGRDDDQIPALPMARPLAT